MTLLFLLAISSLSPYPSFPLIPQVFPSESQQFSQQFPSGVWPNIDDINRSVYLVDAIPEAIATGQVVLEHAGEAALELFCLAGNMLERPVWQNLFDACTGGIADMLWQSREGFSASRCSFTWYIGTHGLPGNVILLRCGCQQAICEVLVTHTVGGGFPADQSAAAAAEGTGMTHAQNSPQQ